MRILVTNDDGINAPGLPVLEAIAASLSDDVWTVAPETEQSGASHSLTLHQPVRLRQHGDRDAAGKKHSKRFSLSGTPTDCVVMGVKHVQEAKGDNIPFDLVLSGVNRGSNLADDVTYSGTIAGAMEGTVLGIPSIALSQAYGFDPDHSGVRWEVAEHFGPGLLAALLDQGWPANVLLNVNFPDKPVDAVSEIEITSQGARDQSNLYADKRQDVRGFPYFWIGFKRNLSNPPEGTDLRAIYEGRISVTPLHLNLTEGPTVTSLRDWLGGTRETILTAGRMRASKGGGHG